jgi:hypothetical protein
MMIPKHKFLEYIGQHFGEEFRRSCIMQLIGSDDTITPQRAVAVMARAHFEVSSPTPSVPDETSLVAALS